MPVFPSYACGMKYQEWDWPPPRRRGNYRASDIYQPSGWGSPIEKKIINIWWRVMIACIKVILITALTIIAFGASWLFWTVLTL
jgi:hypothetical protein